MTVAVSVEVNLCTQKKNPSIFQNRPFPFFRFHQPSATGRDSSSDDFKSAYKMISGALWRAIQFALTPKVGGGGKLVVYVQTPEPWRATGTKILMPYVIYATSVRVIKLAAIGHILALRPSRKSLRRTARASSIHREKQFLPWPSRLPDLALCTQTQQDSSSPNKTTTWKKSCFYAGLVSPGGIPV